MQASGKIIVLEPEVRYSQLYKAIDEILWNNWDPIGVSKIEDWPKDEYYSYLAPIYNMVVANASRNQIAERLFYYESEVIEMRGTFENCLAVADYILMVKAEILG